MSDPLGPAAAGDEQAVATPTDPTPDDSAWRRLRAGLIARPGRDQLVIAVLCALLGFGIFAQVRSVRTDEVLATARPEDLVQLLDSLDQRNQRLDDELTTLTALRERLVTGQDSQRAAAAARRARDNELGILAGTVPAVGPGVVIRMSGPVSASLLLDTVQELRDAGAEAIQIDGVRVVAQTAFVPGARGGVDVDSTTVGAGGGDVVVKAIGDPTTLSSSLRIPGGVVDTAGSDGVKVTIAPSNRVLVDALRPLKAPGYARNGS
jgi:uncharacterized protein YlxW (UPF0749 family)